MSNTSYEGPERIAVVGMACRFPGAENVDAFWRNLRAGVASIERFTPDELRDAGVDPALLERPDFVPAFGALEGADRFDADFFDINPREAELMDPQHRLFLEQAWAALEHAGLDPETFAGPVGVFAGTNMNGYLLARLATFRGRADDGLLHRIRADKDFLATLVSYKLDLRGPSFSVQTACSTSLVAFHLACQSLLDYQCDAALAGGVSINVPLKTGYVAGHGVFSPDGRCRAFDAAGDGTVAGNGVGVVVLKRLSDAIADGDVVHAVVLGSAINNDGAQKVGFTAPSVDGQIEVIALAQAVAGVPAESITYVEAHGTATPMGDPIEVAALTRAFDTPARGFCALGSVKTNIGHTDAAAGVASIIKTVLALREGEIPPSLHFETPNPRIDFASSPFFVADRLLPWSPEGMPRRAGVSAFGVGGTNAHVVLEEPPAARPAPAHDSPELIVLSAKSADALDRLAEDTADHLDAHPDLSLADAAFTLTRGRKAFAHRRALVASTVAEAASLLRGSDVSRVATQQAPESDPGVVFLFSGLGTQYAGMARELYETEPAFREAMDRCFAILRRDFGMDLAAVLYPADAPAGREGSGVDLRAMVRGVHGPDGSDPLQGARWGHPAMFAVGYALAELWRGRGIEPRAVAGHSLGEYVAACVAGVFTLEDALTLVVRRAALLDSIPGAMAAVSLSEDDTRALVDAIRAEGGALWLAAVNAPLSCVVSGTAEAVARFTDRAKAASAVVLPLAVRHPFHSGLLESVRDEFARIVGSLRRSAPAIPLAGNATGKWLRPEQAQSVDYWVDHLLRPVCFAECVDTLRGLSGGAGGEPVMLEVGPGAVLGSWARQQGASRVASSMRHGEQPGSDRAVLLRALGQLWTHGVAVDWTRQGGEGCRAVLPGHPLDRRRYWLEADPPAQAAPAVHARRELRDWFHAPLWRQTPAVDASPDAFRGRRVVVFGGRQSAPLADGLRARGADVVRVEPGVAFADEGARFVVRPSHPDDYAAVARALADRGASGAIHTLHLWSLDETGADVTLPATRDGLERGLGALLHWVQAASAAGLLGDGSTLLGATRGAAAVLGNEPLRPWQAALGGLLKVAPLERSGLRCRSVDVEASGWEDAILREAAHLLSGDGGEAEVAYRVRGRWAPFHAPLPADARPEPRIRARERGVYLVTGGLSAAGLAAARWLAEQGRARLVLTGPYALPPREGWDAWIAEHGDNDAIRRRILAVRELESFGAETRVVAVDGTDPDAMRAVVDGAVAEWGALHGVIHAAGTGAGRPLLAETPETLALSLAPVVAGAVALDRATDGIPLDFFVLCSSLHASFGGRGALEGAASGAFLDAFAAWRTGSGRASVAIDWPVDELAPEDAARVFGRVLEHGFGPRVAVSTRDLDAVADALRAGGTESAASVHTAAAGGALHPRPAGAAAYVEPRSDLEQAVAALYQRALGIAPIGADDDFFQMGGDSLIATQLLTALSERFRVDLPLRALFEAPTPGLLAVAIVQRQAAQVDDDLLALALADL
ncbi:polyketide synthase [Longimicrobium sp.]|uniref:type I polyketide synthase n=1 Tax=Longimicrobium sp. TaxID=2029185 RepID=UPI002E33BD5B|nr:polyketide synthase [Longimicrobium sp.]HEX6042687.1 beta-ketoacyl synthase N-terminal-like domain-containing protein [Longimicrobium sp.]